MPWANVYYIIRITNGIAEEMTNFQISSSKLNCLARNSKKWEISKEAGAQEACFQNGISRAKRDSWDIRRICKKTVLRIFGHLPEKIFVMELKSRKE